ncbi:MAG: hypothetical protein QJT81_12820 [Candidatus Thiothrix putei]|uniref:DUF3782 domain-containing protein n=1 Tax=Candidatus Thiothrix putei TaxID=3080811 RepID=A0AA95HD03_9GAMM|nr:MAG: hypothetical protein QJT81_12820 [Candidatus Thiothrix putei]
MTTLTTPPPTFDDILRLLQELVASQKETDQKFKDTDQQIRDTSQQIKEMSQATDRKIKEVSTQIGRLGNRLGDFIGEAVRPAAVRLFRERGIDVHEVHQNIIAKRDGESLELDLLVVNDTDTVAVECKSNLSIDDVNEHLERLGKLKRLLPRYADSCVYAAVAGMVIPSHVAAYAIRKGLFVIGQNGDDLSLLNDVSFSPICW